MITILTTDNPTVLRCLESPLFKRLTLDHQVFSDDGSILKQVRERKPALVILESLDVTRSIKADPGLVKVRVMVVAEGPLDAETVDRLNSCGADEVFVTPARADELFVRVASLLDLPQRLSRRTSLHLLAKMKSSDTTVDGEVMDLSLDGARLELERPVEQDGKFALEITPSVGRRATVGAEVVWQRPAEGEGERTACGVRFVDLGAEDLRLLTAMSLWDLTVEPDGTCRVLLQGAFTGRTDFSGLSDLLSGTVEFDMADLDGLDDGGARRWEAFLSSLDRAGEIRFVRCSVPFITRISADSGVRGGGRVESFFVPYGCGSCGRSEERLVSVAAIPAWPAWEDEPPPPLFVFTCVKCGGRLGPGDAPEGFFDFLKSG